MVDQLTYIESGGHNPYRNLAIEEYLLFHCGKYCVCSICLVRDRATPNTDGLFAEGVEPAIGQGHARRFRQA